MKKNKILYLFLIVVAMFFEINEVNAAKYSNTQTAVQNNHAYLLCEYNAQNSRDAIQIYYHPINKTYQDFRDYGLWEVYYKTGNNYKSIGDSDSNSFIDVFGLSNKIHYGSTKTFLTTESKFECTNSAFIDTDWSNEVCLTNEKDCGKKFDRIKLSNTNTNNSIFTIIDLSAESYIRTLSLKEATKENIDTLIKNKTRENIKANYFSNGNEYPAFIENYIKNLGKSETFDYSEVLNAKTNELKNELETRHNSGEISDEEYTKLSEGLGHFQYSLTSYSNGTNNSAEVRECRELLPSKVRDAFNNIIDFIKFLGPILVIIFTIIDLLKVVTNGDISELKKNASRFGKRIIAAISIFFIPTLIGVIFSFINGSNIFNPCTYSNPLDLTAVLPPEMPSLEEDSTSSSSDVSVPYSDDIIENFAAFITREAGTDPMIGQLMVGAVYINNLYDYNGKHFVTKPEEINADTMCQLYSYQRVYADGSKLCGLTFANFSSKFPRGGGFNEKQKEQARTVAKLLLAGKFTIPKNVHLQASRSIVTSYGSVWGSVRSNLGTYTYYGVPYTYGRNISQAISKVDLYGNSVSSNFNDYKTKADELYATYISGGASIQTNTNTGTKASRIVFIGDSRTAIMYESISGDWGNHANYNIGGEHQYNGDIFIAQGSMYLPWYKSTAIPAASKYLEKGTALLIQGSINGIANNNSAEDMISYLNANVDTWTKNGAKVYFIAAGPSSGSCAYAEKVAMTWNNKIKSNMSSKIYYIDLYDYLKKNGYKFSDAGCHYDATTSKKIYNYLKSQV